MLGYIVPDWATSAEFSSSMIHTEPLWCHFGATLGHSGPLWSTLGHSGPLWYILGYLGLYRATQGHSGHSGPRWATFAELSSSLVHSGPLLATLVPLGCHSGPLWYHSGPLRDTPGILGHLGPFLATLGHFRPLRAILDHSKIL